MHRTTSAQRKLIQGPSVAMRATIGRASEAPLQIRPRRLVEIGLKVKI
jgi:hypothetical protein